MPDVVTVNIVIFLTLAMPAALLIAAAILAKTTKSQHE
jgi:hypothetical protein